MDHSLLPAPPHDLTHLEDEITELAAHLNARHTGY